MKKTFLAMVMAGGSMVMFAQTTPVTPTNPTSPTSPVTPTTTPTATPATSTPAATNKVTNSTTDPLNTTTNQQVNVNTNSGNWNNTTNAAAYPQSTSWTPGTSPAWGWNSYGIWNNTTSAASTTNGSTPMTGTDGRSGTTYTGSSASNAASAATDMTTSGSAISNNSYNAYSGTAVSSLPYSVQTNFSKDYPNPTNNQYSWNQYGDWFSTYYTSKGRLTQYFYDDRGRGYSLSLPVVQTYVPEDVIDKALQKYGAQLYSIGTVKTAEGKDAYQIGLLNHGQLHSDYLNEDGSSVASVWRTEEISISSASANAAMDSQSSVNGTEANGENTSMSAYQDTSKHKMKAKHGKMKTKSKGHRSGTDSTSTSPAMKEQ